MFCISSRLKQNIFILFILSFQCQSHVFTRSNENSAKKDKEQDLFWLEGLREEEIDISHRTDSLSMLILTSLLIITVLSAWLFKLKKFGWLHETGFSLILGIIVGGLIRLSLNVMVEKEGPLEAETVHLTNSNKLSVAPAKLSMNISGRPYIYYLAGVVMNNSKSNVFYGDDIEQLEAKSSFNPEIFFYVLLPPIVFYAGYQLQRFYFFGNMGSILVLAFVGTGISFFITGAIVYGYMILNKSENYFTFSESMLFSAIISATDPVTILAIFNEIRVEHDIYALVFGESVINDAVAIGLHKAVLTYMRYPQNKDVSFDGWSFAEALLNFFSIFVGSFFVGTSLACVTALITKLTKIGMFPLLETALILLMSYSTFLISEVANWSGIVAVLFCGISQKHYTYHNLSLASSIRVVQLFELFNFLAESFIFSYIGLSVFLSVEHKWDLPFIAVVFVSLQVSRAFAIYPLCLLLNLYRDPPIPFIYMHILTWSGLRGAMAFALAIRNTATEVRQVMLTATLSSVLISVLFQGGLTFPLIKLLKIKNNISPEIDELQQESRMIISKRLYNPSLNNDKIDLDKIDDIPNNGTPGNDDLKNRSSIQKQNKIIVFFHNVDQNYLLPFLTNIRTDHTH
ncbi:hypothetical protein MXB_5355 [Myxobolus squamalis]|nr:hypothetical protein MXB_5355 [Myxobolus squamalis]